MMRNRAVMIFEEKWILVSSHPLIYMSFTERLVLGIDPSLSARIEDDEKKTLARSAFTQSRSINSLDKTSTVPNSGGFYP